MTRFRDGLLGKHLAKCPGCGKDMDLAELAAYGFDHEHNNLDSWYEELDETEGLEPLEFEGQCWCPHCERHFFVQIAYHPAVITLEDTGTYNDGKPSVHLELGHETVDQVDIRDDFRQLFDERAATYTGE